MNKKWNHSFSSLQEFPQTLNKVIDEFDHWKKSLLGKIIIPQKGEMKTLILTVIN